MSKEPDHYLEEFWKYFKDFLKKLSREFQVIKNYININTMSANLNYLKSESKYIEIEKTIEKYIINIGWVMIKNYDSYYFGLYNNYLKIWRKVPSIITDKIESDKYFKHINDVIFELYMSLVINLNNSNTINPKYTLLFNQLHMPDYGDNDDIIASNKYNHKKIIEILPLIIEEKKANAITIITRHIDISKPMMELYNVNVPHRMDGRKVLLSIDKQIT